MAEKVMVALIGGVGGAVMFVIWVRAALSPGLSPLWSAADEHGRPLLKMLRGCMFFGLAALAAFAVFAALLNVFST